ncbi:hypothetical protein B0H10DRAFT_2208769 [Mycena sp. CBHHK59/15]|nr:hypothetical protein B0H10DRAFT_2208769 [Mycena sp. CBHHK59/15]
MPLVPPSSRHEAPAWSCTLPVHQFAFAFPRSHAGHLLSNPASVNALGPRARPTTIAASKDPPDLTTECLLGIPSHASAVDARAVITVVRC